MAILLAGGAAQNRNRPKPKINTAKHRMEPKIMNWIPVELTTATQRNHSNDVIVLYLLVYVTKGRNCKP